MIQRRSTSCRETWRDLHRPQRLCDRTHNCRSVEKRDCIHLPKQQVSHTRAKHGFQMMRLAFSPVMPLPSSSSLGKSVSSFITQISRVTSDPVPTYLRMEITPSMQFTSNSNNYQVALRLPALLHHMRSLHGVKDLRAETGQTPTTYLRRVLGSSCRPQTGSNIQGHKGQDNQVSCGAVAATNAAVASEHLVPKKGTIMDLCACTRSKANGGASGISLYPLARAVVPSAAQHHK